MKSIVKTLILTFLSYQCIAATRTWNGTTGNWSDSTRWGGTVPQNGDDAVINSGSVLLSSDTAVLGSLTMGGGTLTCSNWNTRIRATNVVINGGTLTLPSAFSTNSPSSNRVWIVATNFTLGASAQINADYAGYLRLNGPGAGSSIYSTSYGSGAGYGGEGRYDTGGSPGGKPYGNINAPIYPGSGGGHPTYGGAGGGAAHRHVGRCHVDRSTTRAGRCSRRRCAAGASRTRRGRGP